MTKEASVKEELRHFLLRHCEVKTAADPAAVNKNKVYIFRTKDCTLFMAEAYIQGMRKAIGQNEEVMSEAKKRNDFSEVIMVYNWAMPDPGMDIIQLPDNLINKITKEQAEVFLRNLQFIQKDIDEGVAIKTTLGELFGETAIISTHYALGGERQFFITGTTSSGDRRGYAERYAEVAATNALFDLSKALNASLRECLPEHARDIKYFIEGRGTFNKKMRYGSEARTELLIEDEGASTLMTLTKESANAKAEINKIFERAMLDPVGLALKYYLGKHPLIKLPGTDGK